MSLTDRVGPVDEERMVRIADEMTNELPAGDFEVPAEVAANAQRHFHSPVNPANVPFAGQPNVPVRKSGPMGPVDVPIPEWLVQTSLKNLGMPYSKEGLRRPGDKMGDASEKESDVAKTAASLVHEMMRSGISIRTVTVSSDSTVTIDIAK